MARPAPPAIAPSRLTAVAAVLRLGGLIAYPTDTVYGLGCLPDRPRAIRRLLALKGRPADKGLILLASEPAQLAPWTAPLTDADWARIADPAAPPTTWLVPAAPGVSPLVRGAHASVAVRLTRHALVAALTALLGQPIISTSANPAGQPPVRRAADLDPALRRGVDLVLAGACGPATRPSRIRELASGRLLRA